MKTQIFECHRHKDMISANGDFQQLELDFEAATRVSAKILCFSEHRARVHALSEGDDASRRLLEFAATLPDW
ncbi:hypothetical protein D7T48_13830 [Stenotrophomonas maltophilia]|uniref:hypothetical protein n=1 Tax=Stenotrophomonas TaxID=40323 RepID=UPI000747DE14|nr:MULTISPECIES: hypothetical protein [Stenotrophomonas]ELC7323541.1 hypothetical protein [Stenotrophomonas maltophilia]KUJ05168.1 hypothetical protein AR275_33660 [Stenotrophomonas maltophilia]MBA0277290.1 hypothetical protein [Stenotrophomonas maltophilia]MBA0412653.1 hypothetical protein [Stenotrophomonas maltophilia]MBA0445049.1 hypothetical protein [Stenotrophomonas maltophilia]